jgi:hypothetical protein
MARCVKINKIVSMVIIKGFIIIVKVLVIIHPTGTCPWKNVTNSICQNNSVRIATMLFRHFKGKETLVFQYM